MHATFITNVYGKATHEYQIGVEFSCSMMIGLMHALCVQGTKFGKDLREGEPAMETRILESSINKICSLLAVGFGDAGAEVDCMRCI